MITSLITCDIFCCQKSFHFLCYIQVCQNKQRAEQSAASMALKAMEELGIGMEELAELQAAWFKVSPWRQEDAALCALAEEKVAAYKSHRGFSSHDWWFQNRMFQSL